MWRIFSNFVLAELIDGDSLNRRFYQTDWVSNPVCLKQNLSSGSSLPDRYVKCKLSAGLRKYCQLILGRDKPQYYTRARLQNTFVRDGVLTIKAIKEDYKGAPYTSASIITKGKYEFTKGRVEVRAKLPSGKGVWPAIWTLGTNIDKVGWPMCGEIDIMEYWGHNPHSVHANVHTGQYNHSKGTGRGGHIKYQNPWEDFHIFAVEWYDDRLDFYFDDTMYYSCKNKGEGIGEWPFVAPQYLLINLAFTRGEGSVDQSIFPVEYLIDYVRIYEIN